MLSKSETTAGMRLNMFEMSFQLATNKDLSNGRLADMASFAFGKRGRCFHFYTPAAHSKRLTFCTSR